MGMGTAVIAPMTFAASNCALVAPAVFAAGVSVLAATVWRRNFG
jgi:hypothetical protein